MHSIKTLTARQILDSRGNPTVEVDITLADGSFGRASVPSGASTGSHEAVELRDGNKKVYLGKGVLKAVENVNTVIKKGLGKKEYTQATLDEAMIALDGTANKKKLGANAILGVSLAFAHAAAQAQKKSLFNYFKTISKTKTLSLPVPMMNLLNGGKHALKSTDIQEFMVVPHGFKSFSLALQAGTEIFHTLKSILHKKGYGTTVGDEGGFAPSLSSNEEALSLLVEAITAAGYKPGKQVSIALDVAATELYIDGKYDLACEGRKLSTEEIIEMYEMWCKKYPIVSIEDALSEDDWDGYVALTKKLGKKVQLVGDDLFVTNVERLQKGIDMGACNSILIKLNQIGTVTETINAVKLAEKNDMTAIISHRSGETEDATIADVVVGLSTGQIKTGSASRTDRTSKYNQLLRIEEALKDKAVIATPFK